MRNLYTTISLLTLFCLFTNNIQAQTTYPNDRSVLDSTIQPFYHGVASGDPLQNKVIIWTRVTTDTISVPVKWRVALDTNMSIIVAQGSLNTDASKDYTVKVDVTNLQPNTYYYYEFEVLGRLSQRGRTKTLPTGNVDNLRVALVSCSNYSFGYFNPYDRIKESNDIDFVIHVGDYIYEDGFKIGGVDTIKRRTFPEFDAYDIPSYRLRYSWYHLDPSLRNLHQQYPMVVIWDDHEFANDAFADTSSNHRPATQGTWAARKANAIRVFKEWIPMREDTSKVNIIAFKQNIGNLADIIYTEDRIEKFDVNDAQQGTNLLFNVDNISYDTPNRTMHGFRQMDWMCSELKKSTAKWKILANQVVFSTYVLKGSFLGQVFPIHQAAGWDMYPLERKRVIDTVNFYNIKNMVVLSGDIHVAMAFDVPSGTVPYDATTGAGSAGVEFVCDNVVSGGIFGGMESYMYTNNKHLKYVNPKSTGYTIVNITQGSACADFWETDYEGKPSATKKLLGTWCTLVNQNHLKPTQGPTFTPRVFPPLVPLNPRNNGVTVGIKNNQNIVELMALYPNPTNNFFRFQYFMKTNENLSVVIYDILGNEVQSTNLGLRTRGLNEDVVYLKDLPAAEYIVSFKTQDGITTRKIVKF
jgi:alkaline phosphatase D